MAQYKDANANVSYLNFSEVLTSEITGEGTLQRF